MLGYLIVFLCIAVCAMVCIFLALGERSTFKKIARAPYISDYKSAFKAIEEMRRMDNITSPRLRNTQCNIMMRTLIWVEDNEKRHKRNQNNIDTLNQRLQRFEETEKLVKKMSVIVLNQQEKQ